MALWHGSNTPIIKCRWPAAKQGKTNTPPWALRRIFTFQSILQINTLWSDWESDKGSMEVWESDKGSLEVWDRFRRMFNRRLARSTTHTGMFGRPNPPPCPRMLEIRGPTERPSSPSFFTNFGRPLN